MRIGAGVQAPLGEQRGFIHRKGSFFRKLGGTILGNVPVVGGIAKGILQGVGVLEGPGIGAAGCPPGTVRLPQGGCGPAAGVIQFQPIPFTATAIPGVGGAGCPPGFRRLPQGGCTPLTNGVNGPEGGIFQGDGAGKEEQLLPFGQATLGRFGAGSKPAFFSQQVRRCPRGSILGAAEADGSSLCYGKTQISNKERAWPRGRPPLLTGGEVRAISIASSAAKKLERKQKQLQKLGMLKKPVSRARGAAPRGRDLCQ